MFFISEITLYECGAAVISMYFFVGILLGTFAWLSSELVMLLAHPHVGFSSNPITERNRSGALPGISRQTCARLRALQI